MDTEQQDPLAVLVVDAEGIDRARLANALQSWARVDPHKNLIRFLPGTRERSTIRQRVLVALLGQMTIKLLNGEQDEGLTPSELERCTGAKGSSVRPKLKSLADEGIVLKNDDGKYIVPQHAFDRAVEEVGDDDS